MKLKEIKISEKYKAQVDDEDYEMLSKYKWRILKSKNKVYAITQLFMHRLIMKAEDMENVDHVDTDTLNNVKSNLRIATDSQNRQHSRKQKETTSKYKGVYWRKEIEKWQANIFYEGKQHYLGQYENEEEAGKAYDVEARKHFGEFANLNFKE